MRQRRDDAVIVEESCPCCDVSVSLQFRSEDLIARNVAVSESVAVPFAI